MACDLKPHTWYTVEIRARPLTSRGIETGFWSEAVAHMELTKEDGKIWLNWNFVCLLTASPYCRTSPVAGQPVNFLYVQVIPLSNQTYSHLMHLWGNLCLSNVFNEGMAILNRLIGYSVE